MNVVNCAIEGRIVQQQMNEETKSEGVYSYLVDSEQREYRLFRQDEAEFDDPFFDEYLSKSVVVRGDLIDDKWLRVTEIEVLEVMDNECE